MSAHRALSDEGRATTLDGDPQRADTDASRLLDLLRDRGLTLAVAESLTGGLVSARLVDVPGASLVLRGGVVAYATELKAALLAVDAHLLAREGAVHPDVAVQMAQGVRQRLHTDVGLATTGVAGPDPQDGHPPGTVHVAVATGTAVQVATSSGAGTRGEVRERAVRDVLALALAVLGPASGEGVPDDVPDEVPDELPDEARG